MEEIKKVLNDFDAMIRPMIFVLMFELSRSYLTPLVESGFLHGEDCRTWNVFRELRGFCPQM